MVIHTGSATQTGASRALTASDAEDGDGERHGHQRVLQIQTPDRVTAEAMGRDSGTPLTHQPLPGLSPSERL